VLQRTVTIRKMDDGAPRRTLLTGQRRLENKFYRQVAKFAKKNSLKTFAFLATLRLKNHSQDGHCAPRCT
jgi:predicted DNA-binding ribbon-helix-helix protein